MKFSFHTYPNKRNEQLSLSEIMLINSTNWNAEKHYLFKITFKFTLDCLCNKFGKFSWILIIRHKFPHNNDILHVEAYVFEILPEC